MRLISVVMGEADNKIRNQDIMSLLNYGFSIATDFKSVSSL